MNSSENTESDEGIIILNHHEDHKKARHGCDKSVLCSIDNQNRIRTYDDVSKHTDWQILLYNCTDSKGSNFQQEQIAKILRDKEQSPKVFIHRGGEVLLSSRITPYEYWDRECVGRKNPIQKDLSAELKRLRALGVPMSRGGSGGSGLRWNIQVLGIFDEIIGSIKNEIESIGYNPLPYLQEAWSKGLEYYLASQK